MCLSLFSVRFARRHFFDQAPSETQTHWHGSIQKRLHSSREHSRVLPWADGVKIGDARLKRTWLFAARMSAFDPKRTFGSSCLARLRSDAAQTFQFGLPNLSFQSLITPGGNSRLPTPVRRQASGHISSKEWSSLNSSLWETWSASERGHRSAAIFRSSMSVATSCLWVSMTTPSREGTYT